MSIPKGRKCRATAFTFRKLPYAVRWDLKRPYSAFRETDTLSEIHSLDETRAIGEKLFANSGKKRYNEFEVKKDVKH